MFQKLFRRLRSHLCREQTERAIDAEMRFHLEMQIAENLRRGMSSEDARLAALRSFGGVEQTREACRDVARFRWIEDAWQDLHYGIRVLLKNPGFTIVAVVTIALGIGANTAIFSAIYGVLLRPLPYQDGEQLVVLRQQAPLAGVENMGFSVKEIQDYREQNHTLGELVEYHSMSFILYGGDEPDRIQTGVVSADFFEVIGVKPLMGRTFLPSDETHGAEPVLVLSYDYWQRRHGGDQQIVGKVFTMNDRPHIVVGVLPPVPQYPNDNDVYMPTSDCPTRSSERFIGDRNSRMMGVFGRLKPAVTLEQARGDLAAVAAQLQQAYPGTYLANSGFGAEVSPLHKELTRQAEPTFLVLLGTAGLVLLAACFNVANLTLARVMRREREMAVRTALGASRARLVRQLLTESALVAFVGAGLGLVLALYGLDLLTAFAARLTPRAAEIRLDGPVLIFTLTVAVVTGLIFGLLPALSVKTSLVNSLKDGTAQATVGTARRRLRASLLVAQVAVSFTLLIGAGLMLRSLFKLQQVHPGFNPERVLVMRLSNNWSKYNADQQYVDFYRRVVDTTKALPGVLCASMSSSYPLNSLASANGPFTRPFQIEGRPPVDIAMASRADRRFVTPDFGSTIGLPLIRGRHFRDSDDERAPSVALITESLARNSWPDDDPLGKRLSFNDGESWSTIVGIVGDVRQYGLERGQTEAVYQLAAQGGFANYLLVRTASDPAGAVKQIRETVHEIDPETAIDQTTTLEQARGDSLASPRLTAILLSLFAGLALVITAAGIAGVMALSVTQRKQEIGIRMALGATRGSVLMMVMRSGMVLVLSGLVLGIMGSLILTKLMSSLLFSVQPTDPLTFIAVSLVIFSAAVIASYLPARRVSSIDPMLAVRSE
jgi:predicted permease